MAHVSTDLELPNVVNKFGFTTLSIGIDAVQTSITLANATLLTTTGGVIQIEDEIIKFESKTGNVLNNCVRGIDDTSAAAHIAALSVTSYIVAENFNALKSELQTSQGEIGQNETDLANHALATATHAVAKIAGTTDTQVSENKTHSKMTYALAINASTGADATITPLALLTKLTGAALSSITGIVPTTHKVLILVADTGSPFIIKNEAGTAANQIITGTGDDLEADDGLSLYLVYDVDVSKWRIVGGSGGKIFLDDLEDVVIDTPTNGQHPEYNVDTTKWENKAPNAFHTSLFDGGLITINADPTKFDLAAGSGQIVDTYTNPLKPIKKNISWVGQTAVLDTGIGSGPLTYIGIDSGGAIDQLTAIPTPEQRRDLIIVGATLHIGAAITSAIDYSNVLANDLGQTVQDMAENIGPMRFDGILHTPNIDLTFGITAGTYFGAGYRAILDKKNPNYVAISSQPVATFLTTYKDGGGDYTVGAPVTDVPVGFYDNGSGVLQAVPVTNWSILRLFSTSASNVLQYGQNVYTSHTEALDAINRESFTLNPALERSLHVGYIVVRNDCADLSDTERSIFIYTGHFHDTIAGSASILPNNVFKQAQLDIGDPTGHLDATESIISFVDGTRTFSIAPTATKFDYYIRGQKYRQTTTKSIIIPDTEGLHLICFDGDELRSDLPGVITEEQLLSEFAFTALIYWDADNAKALILADERHGASLDWKTHQYLHNTRGTAFQEGLGLTLLVDQSGSDDEDAQAAIANGVIWDEDIEFRIQDGLPQDLFPIGQIPVLYRSGLDASSIWRKKDADNFPFVYSGDSTGYVGGSGRAPFNENNGGTWQFTQLGNGNHCLTHIFATDDINHPIIAIHGQGEYSTAADAREGAVTEISSIDAAGLPGKEFKAIGTIIIQSAGYSNTPQARFISTDTGDSYVDFRTTTFVAASAATTHGSLLGLNEPGQHPASSITNTPSGSVIATDAQAAINELGKYALTPKIETANFTFESGVNHIADTEAGVITGTLPAVIDSTFVTGYEDRKRTFSTNALTIATTGSDTVGGAASRVVNDDAASAMMIADLSELNYVFASNVVAGNGAIISEWTDFTPVITGVTTSTNSGTWRRVGNDMELRVRIIYSATPTGDVTFALPSGYTIDLSKLPSDSSQLFPYGRASFKDNSTASVYDGSIESANAVNTFDFWGSGAAGAWDENSPVATPISSDSITASLLVPIAEWAGTGTTNLNANAIKRTKLIELDSSDVTASTNLSSLVFKGGNITCYDDGNDKWKAEGTVTFSASFAAAANFVFSMSKLKFKNTSGFFQKYGASADNANFPIRSSYVTPNTSSFTFNITSATGAPATVTFLYEFDLELEEEPTEYTLGNLIKNPAVGVEEATTVKRGTIKAAHVIKATRSSNLTLTTTTAVAFNAITSGYSLSGGGIVIPEDGEWDVGFVTRHNFGTTSGNGSFKVQVDAVDSDPYIFDLVPAINHGATQTSYHSNAVLTLSAGNVVKLLPTFGGSINVTAVGTALWAKIIR
jgi:hypothetical protein